eukprot:scaffold90922_cov75-Phaeocystis_antarctica.AAC.6
MEGRLVADPFAVGSRLVGVAGGRGCRGLVESRARGAAIVVRHWWLPRFVRMSRVRRRSGRGRR